MNSVEREDLLQLFMASLPAAVTLLDVDGKVRTWSPGARDITGYAADEIEGRNISCLFTRDDIAAGKPALALSCALTQGRHEETSQRVRKDGTEVKVQSMLRPLLNSNKELVGFSSLMRDVMVPVQPNPEGARILVVDDDLQVLESVSQQLTSLGYYPVVASSGREALDLLAREPHIVLLLTDVVMPGGMGGREVAEAARRMQPNLKVLYTSGYFEGALQRNGKIDSDAQLLPKPYRRTKLAEKVLEVLKAPA